MRKTGTQELLTARERRVLILAAAGCTNKQIGARMRVSETTVKFHFANIFRKLNVGSRTQALSVAIAHRWVRPPVAMRRRAE